MIRLFLSIVFLLTLNIVIGKELPKDYDAPVELSKIDQIKMRKALELNKEARELWDVLNSRYNPENVTSYRTDSIYNKDAYPILIKASKMFLESSRLKYIVYHYNCDEFFKKHRYEHPSGLEEAKKFQKESASYMDSALLNRRAAENFINQYVQAYNRFYEAISLELIATKKEARALQIYRDWPAHYSYDWDEDIEQNLFAVKPKAIIDEEKILETKPDTAKEAPPLVVREKHDTSVIYYTIQIAAHTVPMTESHIRNSIYQGPMLIREIWEDGWYKYLIGYFKNLSEAQALLRKINVDKAFIVVYKNNKRVALKDLAPEEIKQ